MTQLAAHETLPVVAQKQRVSSLIKMYVYGMSLVQSTLCPFYLEESLVFLLGSLSKSVFPSQDHFDGCLA